jgi:hypothetical protein
LHNWEQAGKKYRRLECAAMDDNERGFFRRMKRDESHDFFFFGERRLYAAYDGRVSSFTPIEKIQ